MQAIKAIYDGNGFMPTQPIPVNEKYVVVITFLEPMETVEKTAVRLPFQFGCMQGQIWMPDDFDAPLEDFEGYM